MDTFNFRSFRKKDVKEMRKVFNCAFEDYLVPVRLTETDFKRKLIDKTNISFKYSVGSYLNQRCVGFLFQTIGVYQEQKTAYNGGTGVIPSCRGNQLTYRMYQHVIPGLIRKNVVNCVLEVLSNNKPAIKSYEKVGFRKSNFFHCLKLDQDSSYLNNASGKNYRIIKSVNPRWDTFESFTDYETSFLDTFQMLRKNMKFERILEAYDGNELVGYIIYNNKMGRVGNIAVNKKHRGKGIGTLLIKSMQRDCRNKPVYILNVNERSYDLLNFFLRLGFRNDIDQFELKLNLSAL
jgi:ribosomal protein S18 acetylase RimI-like enzyme